MESKLWPLLLSIVIMSLILTIISDYLDNSSVVYAYPGLQYYTHFGDRFIFFILAIYNYYQGYSKEKEITFWEEVIVNSHAGYLLMVLLAPMLILSPYSLQGILLGALFPLIHHCFQKLSIKFRRKIQADKMKNPGLATTGKLQMRYSLLWKGSTLIHQK